MVNLCPECGEPLDDFSPCACAMGLTRNRPVDLKPRAFAGGMRGMVARKLEKKRAALARVVVRSKP